MQQATRLGNSINLVVLILCAAFLAGCSGGSLNSASSTTSPTPSGSPTPTPTPAPSAGSLKATPSSLSFGSLALNTSTSQTVQVTNPGNATVNVTQNNLTGAGLSTSLGAPFSVGAGQSFNVSIKFAPTTAGGVNGSLTMSSNGTTVLTIPVTGTGITPQPHPVAISWTASTTSGLLGYNVYRSQTSGGPYTNISTTLPPATLTFTDNGPVSGQIFFYIVTAVNSSGLESVASNEVRVNIPTP